MRVKFYSEVLLMAALSAESILALTLSFNSSGNGDGDGGIMTNA